MAWNYVFMILGILILVPRLYVLEVRFRKEFYPRNRYLSRMLAYLQCIAMIINFSIPSLNFVLLYAFMLEIYIIFKQDRDFFHRYHDHKPLNNMEPHHPWILFERITLHIPLFLTNIVWMCIRMPVFYDDANQPVPLWHAFLGLAIGVVLFLLFDQRNPLGKAFEKPNGRDILIIIFGSAFIEIIIIYLIAPPVIF